MKNNRFSDAQIMRVLKQTEGGVPVPSICREHGISSATFYKWRSQYSGMDVSMISEMKAMSSELARFKRMYEDLSLQHELVKDALGKKL